jgi:hypothetical protein
MRKLNNTKSGIHERSHMETVGYYYNMKEYPIVKENGDYKLIDDNPEAKEDTNVRERLQWHMMNPWEDNDFSIQPKDGKYEAFYISDVYDGVSCYIVGVGDTQEQATTKCIQNLLDLMTGYSKDKVDRIIFNH